MNYLDILTYVWTNHRHYTNGSRQYSNDEIFSDLGYTFKKGNKNNKSYISKGYASRILSGQKKHQAILTKLCDASIQEKIEKTLNLIGLFSCQSGIEIDKLVMAACEGTSNADFCVDAEVDDFHLVRLDSTSTKASLMFEGEKAAQRHVVHSLLNSPQGIIHWGAPPWSGAGYVAHSLTHHRQIKANYQYVCFIRPTEINNPYSCQLEKFANHFELRVDKQNFPQAILDKLQEQKILLVILDACYIPDSESYARHKTVRRLIELAHSKLGTMGPTYLLTIGRSKTAEDIAGGSDTSSLNTKLKVPPTKRFSLYNELFDYYRKLRGNSRLEEGGSRIKRGRWHYETIKDASHREVWPGMVRVRAFFASNFLNYSYFDPMRGFDDLCGPSKRLPRSIANFRSDVIAYLRRASHGPQFSELRALRLCSTAKHWLTGDTLETLRQPCAPKGEMRVRVKELTRETFNRLTEQQQCPIGRTSKTPRLLSNTALQEEVFTLSLGIKAIVQTQWIDSDPFDHAVAHWRVAKRMWQKQDDKELLAQEFPYIPHWGRSRIFILGECIRHLMAATNLMSSLLPKKTDIFEPNFFPQFPNSELGGCDPYEVVNFCYARVFQHEINSNRGFAPGQATLQMGRALSKRHGAFEYAAELLQLMGGAPELGSINKFLEESYHASYLRECAFACLDIGELARAKEIFSMLCSDEWQKFGGTKEDKLSLSLALTELNQLDEATRILNEIKAKQYEHADENEDNDVSPFSRRIATREVHISSLTGNFKEAIKQSNLVLSQESDPLRWDSELVQNKIRSLGNLPDQKLAALKECFAATFRASGEGYQHEALGYRVLLGRIFRQRGETEVAEQILDDAQHDILKYGCSERSYLDLLYESGRTLCAMNKDFQSIRAYASYLRPCLVRARSRQYGRFVNLATKHAETVLENIKKRLTSKAVDSWGEVIDLALEKELEHVKKEKLGREDFFEVDPLFGYYISDSQNIIQKLRTIEGVQSEINLVKGESA